VIRSFRDLDTERLFHRQRVRRFEGFERAALRKLAIVNAASVLGDLAAVPGNRLEKLRGNRSGQFSVRINDQWRICFQWRHGDAHEVEIVDYH